MRTIGRSIVGDMYMGKRFLNADQFIKFCLEVGLHNVALSELEEYESRGWMYPAARLVMPESYALAFWSNQLTNAEFKFDDEYLPYHELEMTLRYSSSRIDPSETDFRHPIDKAWEKVEGLHNPKDETYQSWDSYNISIENYSCPTATHLYHYWQVYEVYQVRRELKGMYQDYTQQYPKSLEYGNIQALVPFFDALSYFQYLYHNRYRQIVDPIQPDADGCAALDAQQHQAIEQSAHDYASQTLAIYHLSKSDLYNALRGMLFLHHYYEQSERYKLAEVLKIDIWRMVELIGFAVSVSPETVSDQIGYVVNGWSSQKSLEILFPNRRKVARYKAGKILVSISTDYNNKVTQNYQFSSQDSDEMLDCVEATDLALFEYALVELNETYFNRTSWYAAESFLRLKSLASFPESLMRTLILESRDIAAYQQLIQENSPTLYVVLKQLAQTQPSVWQKYEALNNPPNKSTPSKTKANSIAEFRSNLNSLIPPFNNPTNEVQFLSTTLALITLLRNFTSHHLIEQPDLLSGQYVYSVRAILNAAFFIWKDAKSREWV